MTWLTCPLLLLPSPWENSARTTCFGASPLHKWETGAERVSEGTEGTQTLCGPSQYTMYPPRLYSIALNLPGLLKHPFSFLSICVDFLPHTERTFKKTKQDRMSLTFKDVP